MKGLYANTRSPVVVEELVARSSFELSNGPVICGVSGGADSLALLILARHAGLEVTAVHVDHGLRRGSAAEAALVKSAALRFGASFEAKTISVQPGSDLEQRARIARLDALGPEALLGHTADDQAETVLINLGRGAGLYGLAGIRHGAGHPILALRRWETEALCAQSGLEPFHDPSNDDDRFVRNRTRTELLPLLADIAQRDPVPLLVRTAEVCRKTADDIDCLAAALDPKDTRALSAAAPTVAVAALRNWLRDDLGHPPSGADLGRVMAVVRHDVIACEIAGGRRIARSGGMLRIVELDPSP